jgi:GT2 family glycosyltransferase
MVTTCASAAYTAPALESFFEHTPWQDGDVFLLIDNDASSDRSLIVPWCDKIRVVVNQHPLSFAANGNQVINHAAQSKSDAYFLNNDVIFTADWIAPLAAIEAAVVTPTCNQNYQYQVGDLELKPIMTLANYLGREQLFRQMVEQHKSRHTGYVEAYKTNFFCVKIPPAVYQSVGLFDTRFGIAGGEDDDYCIRTPLQGFGVLAAIESYLLHFGGRSTWSGPETLAQWRERERSFTAIFEKKWGKLLCRFLFHRDASVVSNDPSLQAVQQREGIAGLFKEMARREGISVENVLSSAV